MNQEHETTEQFEAGLDEALKILDDIHDGFVRHEGWVDGFEARSAIAKKRLHTPKTDYLFAITTHTLTAALAVLITLAVIG